MCYICIKIETVMGVDTKLFVATKKENILKAMPKVIKALNEWQRNLLDEYWDRKGFDNKLQFMFRDKEVKVNKNLKDFTNGIRDVVTYDFKSFSVYFTVDDEKRRLFVTHMCSNDYSEVYKGDKIIFSLGCWGLSEEIMMVLAEAVKEFGDVYYDYNDCDNIDFKKITNK